MINKIFQTLEDVIVKVCVYDFIINKLDDLNVPLEHKVEIFKTYNYKQNEVI